MSEKGQRGVVFIFSAKQRTRLNLSWAGAEGGRSCHKCDRPHRGVLRVLLAAAETGDSWVEKHILSFPLLLPSFVIAL